MVEQDGRWNIVKDSPCNRKITADTPAELTDPAHGHDLLKTAPIPPAPRRSAPGTIAVTVARLGASIWPVR